MKGFPMSPAIAAMDMHGSKNWSSTVKQAQLDCPIHSDPKSLWQVRRFGNAYIETIEQNINKECVAGIGNMPGNVGKIDQW